MSSAAAFHQLVPLRIPSGWEVVFNNFVELESPETLDPRERDAYLSQDLLSIRSTAPPGTPSAGFALDVGWTTDGDPRGAYRLRLFHDSAAGPVVALDSVHGDVIRDAIAVCLNRLNEGASPARIQELIDAAVTVDGERAD